MPICPPATAPTDKEGFGDVRGIDDQDYALPPPTLGLTTGGTAALVMRFYASVLYLSSLNARDILALLYSRS
jgi:hypothetical protein